MPSLGILLGQRFGGPPPPVDTFNSLFPGAWWIIGDGIAPVEESDRWVLPDTTGNGNDAWQMKPGFEAAAPWDGGVLAFTTLDGYTVPQLDGSSSKYAGLIVNTPGGAAHTACTVVTVVKSTSGGPRAIQETMTPAMTNSAGVRVGTNTDTYHTQGMKAAGTDQDYANIPQTNLDLHISIANPASNSLRIYKRQVLKLSTTCASWAKPSHAFIYGRLAGGLWSLTGNIMLTAYYPFAWDLAWVPLADGYCATRFPSLAP
jgi:hypothetical protein